MLDRKHRLVLAVGLLLSVAALGVFCWKLRGHWQEVGAAFARADYVYVVPALGALVVVYALRVWRWGVFLRPLARVRSRDIASATLIGFMANSLLPLRAGEVIRPYVLHRKSGISFGHAAGTAMGLERMFDLIGVCMLVMATLALVGAEGGQAAAAGGGAAFVEELRRSAVVLAGLTFVGLCVMVAVALRPSAAMAAAEVVLSRLPERLAGPLRHFAGSVVQSLGVLREPAQVALALALSAVQWFLFPVSTYALARGFGLDIPFSGIMLAQVLVTAGVALPQAPGFIGVFQLAAMVGVQLYGVPKADAAAFASALWALNVFPVTVVGLAVLWGEGLNLGGLARASREAMERPET